MNKAERIRWREAELEALTQSLANLKAEMAKLKAGTANIRSMQSK